jgi:RHS repeat-associated protein
MACSYRGGSYKSDTGADGDAETGGIIQCRRSRFCRDGVRYYDPDLGRFLQMDDWLGSSACTLTLNRYVYSCADPVSLLDPSGLAVFYAGISGVGGIGPAGTVAIGLPSDDQGHIGLVITVGGGIGKGLSGSVDIGGSREMVGIGDLRGPGAGGDVSLTPGLGPGMSAYGNPKGKCALFTVGVGVGKGVFAGTTQTWVIDFGDGLGRLGDKIGTFLGEHGIVW